MLPSVKLSRSIIQQKYQTYLTFLRTSTMVQQ